MFWLLTTGGLGYLRPASGTWGSMPPVALAGVLILAGFGPADAPVLYHAVIAAICILFCWATIAGGDRAEARWGKDPSNVVSDETGGQCLALIALPVTGFDTDPIRTLIALAIAFLAFRVFDILKLPPANGLQRLPAGWGILLDDLVAGLQALLVVQLAMRLVF